MPNRTKETKEDSRENYIEIRNAGKCQETVSGVEILTKIQCQKSCWKNVFGL